MSNQTTPFLSNNVYNSLKWIAQIFLPALGALYFSLSEIWGLPYGVEVVGTITSVDLFLGLLLGLSTKRYNNSDAKYDGVIQVTEDEDRKRFDLQLNDIEDPNDLDLKDEVLFKVTHDMGPLAP